MSRDPLEEQEADPGSDAPIPHFPLEREPRATWAYPLTDLLRKYNALPPEERHNTLNPVLGAPYGKSQDGLWGYSASMQAGDTFGVQINKDALPYKPEAIYASFARSAFHHGMSMHKKISYVKSAVRIAGSIVGVYAFGTYPAAVAAFFLLGISEVVGIIEEQFETK